MIMIQFVIVALHLSSCSGFSNALFQKAPSAQKKAPTKTPDRVEIELPNFDELFYRVQQVSPLAQVAIESANDVAGYTGGFNDIGKIAVRTESFSILCSHFVVLQSRTQT